MVKYLSKTESFETLHAEMAEKISNNNLSSPADEEYDEAIYRALSACGLESITLKPEQEECLRYLHQGEDLVAILPTGFGKSLIFQLLPFLLPTKETKNIVLVIAPLTSIIEDQVLVLQQRGITAGVLHIEDTRDSIESLFLDKKDYSAAEPTKSNEIINGNFSLLFAHPEALLNDNGRTLMSSKVYQNNVVALVVDEAHCVDSW